MHRHNEFRTPDASMRRELWRGLVGGARVGFCGDAKRMAKDVDRALHEIAAEQGRLGEVGATKFVKRLRREGRYLWDVY